MGDIKYEVKVTAEAKGEEKINPPFGVERLFGRLGLEVGATYQVRRATATQVEGQPDLWDVEAVLVKVE